jgi:NAD(P)-dependent dehydrogenase (short-subunit alcohol dehydrogenase family)
MTTLTGKVALVTGGTSGIGRATALEFARQGAKVAVTGRREKEGLETVELIKTSGGDAIFIRADAANEDDARRTVDVVLQKFGRLDHAFNNAGVEGAVGLPTHEQTAENFRRVMDVNVLGVLLSMKYQVPAMLKAGGGAIVNNASVLGVVGLAGMGVYVASKHAVLGLTRSAALEYARQGVRVNAVSPALVETPMFDRFVGTPQEQSAARDAMAGIHPVGRAGRPEEIASGVVWLCSPGASFVTGTNLLIDGGLSAQ